MKIEKLCSIFALLLILLLGVSFVAANDMEESGAIATNDSSIELNDDLTSVDGVYSSQDNQDQLGTSVDEENSNLKDSEEIEVNDWDDLKYYCSMDDSNKVLKLKENTNYYPTDPSSDDYQIIIKNNVTIVGSPGAYIGDASPNARNISYAPFKVNDKSGVGVTLQGITFKWISTSYATDGVFFILGGNVNNTIKDCTFTNITTNLGHSSIVHIKYGHLELDNVTFTNCTTDFGCVSVYCPEDDATKLCTRARMTVRDSYFADNYAKTEPGCINNCGMLEVYNSTFYRNSAFWWAGAIHTHGGGNTSLYNSKFIDNVAGWNGGALYTYSYLQIYNTTFIGNNCTTDNGGGAIGACKYLHAPYIYVEDSLFENNTNNCWGPDELSSGTGRGGAISIMDEGGIEIRNTTFIHNSASRGSALAIIAQGSYGSPDVTLINNTFIDNTRSGDVLYIYLSQSSGCVIVNNTFINSTIELSKLRIEAEDPVGDEITINIDTALKNPNAYDSDILDRMEYEVYVDGVYYTKVIGKSFVYTFKDDEKHDIFITSSTSSDVSNTLSISNKKEYIYLSQKRGNDNNDGKSQVHPVATLAKAIELARDTGNIHILDGSFSGSNFTIDYDLVITGENNVMITGSGDNLFDVSASLLTFKNVIFSNIKQSVSKAVFLKTSGKLILENCRFNGGNYKYYGIDAREIAMTNVVFENLNYEYYLVNAPILNAENISVINNKFTGNGMYHGFLYSDSVNTWNIMDSLFENNTGLRSGLILIKGTTLSQANIKNTVFNSNALANTKSTSYSACLDIACNLKVDKCVFVNNENIYQSSSPKSAVIYVNARSNIEITNSIIVNNSYGASAEGNIYCSKSNAQYITVNYNWFGTTIDDVTVKPELNPNINCNYWYVLNASASRNELGPNENAIVTYDLNNIVLNNGSVVSYSALELPEVTLNIASVNGDVDANRITLENGVAQVEFTKRGYEDANITADYYSVNSTIDILGTKNTPNLEIEVSNITAGDDLEIIVRLSDDATENAILNIGDESYTLTFTDGVAHKTIPQFKSGNYTVSVTYPGDSKYLSRTVDEKIIVKQLNPSMTIDVVDTYVGNDLEVLVKVPSDATGSISISIGDKLISKEIVDGQAVFAVTGLKANNYTLTASYLGNIRYTACENRTEVSILKYDSTISLDLGEIELNEDLIITVNVLGDMSGNVTFIVNGNPNVVDIDDGKAVFTISSIAKGDYLVEVIYNGDDKYLTSTDSVEFSVGKLESQVLATVENIDYKQTAVVLVTVNSQATGNVSVIVDNKTFTGVLNEGKVSINVDGLTAGDKIIKVNYNGDDNYLPSSNSTALTVNKIDPTFNVNVDSMMVGKPIIVKIIIDANMTGNFTVKIGDKTYSRIIQRGVVSELTVNGLEPDEYDVIITYNGDNNFNVYNNQTKFNVLEYPIPQVSNGGQDTQNTHKSAYEAIANGKVMFEIQLEDNINGSIVIDADGNIYLASNASLFKYDETGELVWNFTSNSGTGSFSGVSIGRDMIIAPEVGDRLYFINITKGLENIHSNMYWGSSLFAPVIDDNYNIYITSEYIYDEHKYQLVVIPYNLWETSLEPTLILLDSFEPISSPIVQGNTVVIPHKEGLYIIDLETNLPAYMLISNNVRPILGLGNTIYAFNGNKIVAINNQQITWETTVTGTVGDNLAFDSEIGYLYSVNKEGVLYRYDIGNGEESVVYDFKESVSSDILIDNQGNLYLGTSSGMFYALDNAGKVLWRVDLASQITGKPVIDENGLIYVTVDNSKIVAITNGEKENSKLNVKVENITVGEDLVMNITFDKSVSGEVTISGNGYNKVLPVGNDGKLSIAIPNLSNGIHSFEIKYSGDMRFKDSAVNVNVSATMDESNTFVVPENSNSKSPTYSISLPEDATGDFTVYVDGKVYKTTKLVNGKASIDVSGLSSGNHKINIVYSGDAKYGAVSKSINLNVPAPVIKLTGSNVVMLYTSGAKYQVRLTSDGVALSGKTVVFTVNGKTVRAVTNKNGYASVKINLPPRTAKYALTATYNGVKISNKVKVNGIVKAKNVKVKKSAKSLKIKVTLKKVNGKYIKSKRVTLKFKGKVYKAKTNKKGVATFKIPKKVIKKLKVGKKYKYRVTYLKQSVNKKITVKR